MGEALPYSDKEVLARIGGACVMEIRREAHTCILGLLDSWGDRIELEIRPEADVLEGESDLLSVYVRGGRQDA